MLKNGLKENEEVLFIVRSAKIGPMLGKPAKGYILRSLSLSAFRFSGISDFSFFFFDSSSLSSFNLGSRLLTRRHSDDHGSQKEKDKDKKGKMPISRMTSYQPDEEKKGGYFKAKVSDKHVETPLEKYARVLVTLFPSIQPKYQSSLTYSLVCLLRIPQEQRGRSGTANKKSNLPVAPKGEEIKFDKKKSKTGKLESFGVDLADQVAREGTGMVPKVVLACTAAVEKRGMERVGIYRLSGLQSKVNKLQLEFMYGNE